jgi:ABC-type Co2+ transport system permease subunit
MNHSILITVAALLFVVGVALLFRNYLVEPTGQRSMGRLSMFLVVLAVCFVLMYAAISATLNRDLLEGLAWFLGAAGTVLYASNKAAFAWGNNKLDIQPPDGK